MSVLAKMHSLFSLNNSGSNEFKLTKKKRRRTKLPEDNNIEEVKPKRTRRKKLEEPVVTKPEKVLTQTTDTTGGKWFKTTDKKPDEFRPIEFHTNYKKPIRGYRQSSGYITDTPYFIDKFKQQNGYVEWRYISYCTSLSKCPKGFPSCEGCGKK